MNIRHLLLFIVLPTTITPTTSTSIRRPPNQESANEAGAFPNAGWNYPLPTRPLTARNSDKTTPGHYENGYPIEDASVEQIMGNPLQYQGKQTTPEWGNGQLVNAPTAPLDPPSPPKYDPNDYYDSESETKNTRDYSKPPVMRDPLPASLPRPSISSISVKSCMELGGSKEGAGKEGAPGAETASGAETATDATSPAIFIETKHFLRSNQLLVRSRSTRSKTKTAAIEDKRWLTLKGDNLGKSDIGDVLGIDIILVDRKGTTINVLPCISAKTGSPTDEDEYNPILATESGSSGSDSDSPGSDASDSSGSSDGDNSESGPESESESNASGPAEDGSGPDAAESKGSAFGGKGSILDRLSSHVGLESSFVQILEEPAADGDGEIVNGVDLKSGNIRELSCIVAEYSGDDAFGYVVIHTLSMGSSTVPPIESVIAGASSGSESGAESNAAAGGETSKDGNQPDNVNFCCNKCPPSDIELGAAADAAIAAAAESEAKLAADKAVAESKQNVETGEPSTSVADLVGQNMRI